MNADEYLKQITIPSPCQADWGSMNGDDRSRFCDSCGKSVVNLSALPKEEAASLIAQGDSLCAKVTRRRDGSVVTRNKMRFSIRSLMGIIAGIAAALAFWRSFPWAEQNEAVGSICPPTPSTSRTIPPNGLPAAPCADSPANSE